MTHMDGKTLHEFERRLVPVRAVAGCNESWARYAADELPVAVQDERRLAAPIQQGFNAGYDAAMNRVRAVLAEMQTESLRQPKPGVGIDRVGQGA